MRTSSVAVVLALLGNATAFSFTPVASRLRNPAAGRKHVFKNALPSSTNALPASPAGTWPQTAVVRGGSLQLSASEEPAAAAAAADGDASTRPPLDRVAIVKYISATAAEFGIIMGLLTLFQWGVLQRVAAKWAKAMVFGVFGFLAMKSRTFAVLNARRPNVKRETKAKAEKRLPQWMPPPKLFPIIWISIGFLRAISTTLVWEALGCNLVKAPIAAMVFHLSIGDTWNHINNVERKLGVAVPVVFMVWLSVANAVYRYYQVLPKAGLVLLPSLIWIGVANLLIQATWRLNGKQPLYPPKEASN